MVYLVRISLFCCTLLFQQQQSLVVSYRILQNTATHFTVKKSISNRQFLTFSRRSKLSQDLIETDLNLDAAIQSTLLLSPADAPSTAVTIPPLDSKGYTMLILLFLVTALCALDRVAMSVAILPMGSEFQYSDSTRGLISSVFSLGYMVGLIPSGLLGTFSSPKKILAYGVLLWSIAQIISPSAAYVNIQVLLAARFFMGVAEAVAIPTVQTFVARWVPENQRSVALGLVLSGLQVGNVCAYVASPTILDSFNWNGLFEIYGAVGFLWLFLWVPIAQDNPLPTNTKEFDETYADRSTVGLQENGINVRERSTILESLKGNLELVPWRRILECKEIRAIAVAHAVQNFGLYINLAWLPSYFSQKYHLGVTDSSLSSVLPWIVAAVVGSGSGYAADLFVQRGVDKTLIRKVAQSFALVVPALTLLQLSVAQDLTSTDAIGYFTVACASASACVAGFGSSVQDVCKDPKLVSTLYGITSAPAVLFGSLGVYLTGVVLDNTQSWELVFRGTAFIYFLGAAYYASQYEAKKLF